MCVHGQQRQTFGHGARLAALPRRHAGRLRCIAVSSLDHTQHRRRSATPRRPVRQHVAALGLTIGLAVAATACDTGDGKTLPEPTGTLPPPTVPTTTTELPLDGVGTLASLPIEQLPADAELPAPVGPFGLTAPWIDGGQIEVINTCEG